MFGIRRAQEGVRAIERGRPELRDETYSDLHHYFARTELTARLHRAVAVSYFGFRLHARLPGSRTPAVLQRVGEAIDEVPNVARAIREYPVKPAAGQWNWVEDADAAMRYHDQITTTSWPSETHGMPNPYGGRTFPRARIGKR